MTELSKGVKRMHRTQKIMTEKIFKLMKIIILQIQEPQ